MNSALSLSQPAFSMFGITVVLTALSFLPVLALRGLRRLVACCLLRHHRTEQAYEAFACFFAGQGIPEPILQGAYQILSHKHSRFPALPVHPSDNLQQVYNLDCYRDDELADLMNVLRTTCGLDFCKPVPAFLPCNTVEDLVYLLAARCQALYSPTYSPCPIPANAPGIGPIISSDRT